MDYKNTNVDYVDLLRELGLEHVESEKERAKIVDSAIKEIKRVKDSLFKRYLDGEISYVQYKENIAQFFKGENPEKVISNIYKKIQITTLLKKSEREPKQLILLRNLKKRRTDTIIVSVAIIALLILVGSFFLNQKNGGITGFFALNENVNQTKEMNQTFAINQSETLEDEAPTLVESPIPVDILEEPILEEPILEPEILIESNTNDSEDIVYDTSNTSDNISVPFAEEEEEEEGQNNQSADISNETIVEETAIDESEGSENIDLNQPVADFNISQTVNESDIILEEIESNQTNTTSLDQSSDGNEIAMNNEIFNTTQNFTNEENKNEGISATPDSVPLDMDPKENQTTSNISENETNITILDINQTGMIYETLVIRNNITHINLSEYSNKSLTFLAVGTNNTAVVVVNEILEVSPISDIDEDLIKIKEYVDGMIFEFLLNITFVDRETFLANIREDDLTNQSTEVNETTDFNESDAVENISGILNDTEIPKKNQGYITPVTLIPFQGIEIDLINATNASAENNGFLETAIRGLDSRIDNNVLLLSYNFPEQTQDFFDTMKIYLIKEEGVETYYLNITLRSSGIFKSKIGSIITANRTVSIDAYNFLESGSCNISCTNDVFNVIDLGNCNFLIENQRSVPILDYCYLEADFEGKKVRQYFELSLSVADLGFSETRIVSENISQFVPKEVSYTKELSQPIQFEEQKVMILDGNQNTAKFNTEISPDNYEVVLVYETEIDNQTYTIREIAQEVDLSDEGFGITGAFVGASRVFSSITDFFTNIIMAIIRFFGGGITGRFAEEISEEISEETFGETLSDENNEITIDAPKEPYDADSKSTSSIITSEENNIDESEINMSLVKIENTNNEENTTVPNQESDLDDNVTEIVALQEDSEESIAFQNASNESFSNETYNFVELNQTLENSTIDNQEAFIDDEINATNESDLEESFNQTDHNVTELNESLELNQNGTLDAVENDTSDNNLNTTYSLENLSSSPSPEYEEVLNETGEEITYEPKEEPNIEELNVSTNQTALAIEAIKEKLSKEIESLKIYSRYDSRNKSIIVYYTANSTFEGLDPAKIKIGVKYYAKKISYTQNLTKINEFVDQYTITIENPYLFDFNGMQLTIDLNTTKSKFYSKGHFATLLSDSDPMKSVLLSNINLQRGSENIISIEASSPTFEFERTNFGEITNVNIFNYLQGELEIAFMAYDENINPDVSFECNNNSLSPTSISNNSYSINLNLCEGSNLTITANKKEVKGAYGRLLGYYTYIDLSSVILKVPENIFLRSNCDDCVVESLCNPATFCPQSNVGLKDWSFVTDLEFNISDAEDILLNSAIKSAELCLYNIYSGDLEGSTLSLGFTNNTACSKVSLEEDIKKLLQNQESKEFKTSHMILDNYNSSSNSSKWVCIDVKDIALNYILNGKNTFVARVIGSDLSGEKGSFSCFDSGILPNEKCKEFGIFGCSPYLNITYEYLD